MVESKLCVGNCLGLHQRQNSSRLWVTGLPSKSDCHSLGKVQGESYLFRCSFGSRYLSHVSEWIIEELWGIVVNSSINKGYLCLLYYRGGYKPYRVATPPQGVPFFGTPPCLIKGFSLHIWRELLKKQETKIQSFQTFCFLGFERDPPSSLFKYLSRSAPWTRSIQVILGERWPFGSVEHLWRGQ